MTSNDLEFLSRVGAELAVMTEMNYAPQDNPHHFLQANPEGASLLVEIADRLSAAGHGVPDNLAFIVGFLPRTS